MWLRRRTDIDQRIARIRAKLRHVQATPPEQFGLELHHYRLNPPLAETDVRAFEATHGIRLPADRRAFLSALGNGGAGPYYGILPLERWGDAWLDDHDGQGHAAYLQSPSPLLPEREYLPDWVETLPAPAYDPYQGAMAVCHQGCTYYTLLIVSGPARGRLVNIDVDLQPPSFVDKGDFLAWYERWLDETLAGYAMQWFGYGLAGGEPELLAVLADPAAPSARQAQALRALCRLPHLSDAARSVVRERLRDDEAQIRAAAVAVVEAWQMRATAPVLQDLLSDPETSVRDAALRALKQWPLAADATPAVQRLLTDPNATIVRLVLATLQQANQLTDDAVAPLLTAENVATRQNAAYVLGTLQTARAGQLLLTALNDADAGVRIHALQALARLRQPMTEPAVAALVAREESPLVLTNAIQTLAAINAPETLPTLLEAATHRSAAVRRAAANALGRLGDRRAIPLLQVLLFDRARGQLSDDEGHVYSATTDRVCDRARWALDQLGAEHDHED